MRSTFQAHFFVIDFIIIIHTKEELLLIMAFKSQRWKAECTDRIQFYRLTSARCEIRLGITIVRCSEYEWQLDSWIWRELVCLHSAAALSLSFSAPRPAYINPLSTANFGGRPLPKNALLLMP
jgi:hypothetical protein